jgi:hypothetical protein
MCTFDIKIEVGASIRVTGTKECNADGELHMKRMNAYVYLLCGLFNDAFNTSDYIASNDRLINE